METIKVNKLHSITCGTNNVLSVDSGHMLTFGMPSPTRPAPPMPTCKPPAKSAEEMLKKALEFANQGMEDCTQLQYEGSYYRGRYCAYEDMSAHLEMLIKEARE